MIRGTHALWLAAPIALALVVACSTFDPVEDVPAGDATTPESSSGELPDAAGDAADAIGPRCDLSKRFQPPAAVMSLTYTGHSTTGARQAGTFLYFVSNRHTDAGGFSEVDLYRAQFAGDEFTEIVHLDRPSDPTQEDVSPTETTDGLTLYLARGDFSARRIWRSVRSDRNLAYPSAKPLDNPVLVEGASSESDPYLVGDTLYFTAVVGTPQFYATNIVTRSKPLRVAHADDAKIRYPVVSADEKELYYIRYGLDGGGPGVPYVARRTQLGDEFPAGDIAPELVLNSVANTTISGLSADGCDLYMSGNASGEDGFVVFRARRPPL